MRMFDILVSQVKGDFLVSDCLQGKGKPSGFLVLRFLGARWVQSSHPCHVPRYSLTFRWVLAKGLPFVSVT